MKALAVDVVVFVLAACVGLNAMAGLVLAQAAADQPAVTQPQESGGQTNAGIIVVQITCDEPPIPAAM